MAKSSSVRYGPKVYEAIIERVAKGELLTKILEEPNMPARAVFYRTIEKPELKAKYEVALLQRADQYVEKALDTANDLLSKGKAVTASESKAAQVAIASYQWLAERLDPRRYGNTQKHEHKHDGAGSYVDVLRAAQGRIKPAEPAQSQAEGKVVALRQGHG